MNWRSSPQESNSRTPSIACPRSFTADRFPAKVIWYTVKKGNYTVLCPTSRFLGFLWEHAQLLHDFGGRIHELPHRFWKYMILNRVFLWPFFPSDTHADFSHISTTVLQNSKYVSLPDLFPMAMLQPEWRGAHDAPISIVNHLWLIKTAQQCYNWLNRQCLQVVMPPHGHSRFFAEKNAAM